MRSRPTLPHLLTGLALLILPVACSRAPGTPAPAAGSTLTPLTLGPGTNTLQYEPFLSATNGWGPVERNHSNGEQAAGDGKTLTLNGVTYPQGFGVHASSDLRFALPVSGVACTRLLADIGVDDEVGTRGSVVFQVYLDGVKAFDSGTLTGSSATRQIDLDVSGRRELRLSVTDAGNGTSYDHADWANPRVVCTSATVPPPPPPTVRHLEYVGVDRALKVYDIDHGYALVRTIPLPGVYGLRGIAASAVTDRLYVPYTGDRADARYAGQPSFGYLLALDLKTDKVLWTRKYSPSVDSLAITPDGKKLYLPSGEDRGGAFWFVLDAATGTELTRIPVFKNAHNTIVGASGKRVYLASVSTTFLNVADTATDKLVSKIGPFYSNGAADSGVRPFTVNAAETLVFVNMNHFSGFEVGDVATGRNLYSVPVQNFPWQEPAVGVQSHGVALTPNEKEVWVLDSYNKYVHVFDVSGLPSRAPVQVADIDVKDTADASNYPKWINFTRDGRYAQISTGHIINVATRTIVTKLDNTRYYLQVDLQGSEPVAAYSRYGVGYGGVPAP